MNAKRVISILGLFFFSIQAFALDTYAAPKNSLVDQDSASAVDYELKTRPPLELGRVAGEMLAGIVCGVALGYLGFQMTKNENPGFVLVDLSGLPGFIVGFTLGASTAVWAIGSIGNQTGSLAAAFGGTLVGIASCLLLPNFGDSDDYILPSALILGGIGGTVAFNMTRRYRADQPMTALIHYKDGRTSLNFPRVSICPSPSRPGAGSVSVGLVNVEW